MTRQDFFKKVGELFTKFTAAQQPQAEGNKEQPQESEKEKTETDAKLATEVTESKEAVTNEGNKEENKDADTFAKQKTLSGNFEVDYPSIAAELGTLRKKVQLLDEYTYLKSRLTQLETQVSGTSGLFGEMLELFKQFGDLPTGEAIQDRKDGFIKSDKSNARADWETAFKNLKGKSQAEEMKK